MKYLIPLLLTPTAALAHPWGHDGLTTADLVTHITTHPDHAALILAAVAAAGFALYRLGARK